MSIARSSQLLDMFSNNYSKWGLFGIGLVILAVFLGFLISYIMEDKSENES